MTKRRKLVPLFVPLLLGMMALTNVVTKPRFATYYKSDVLTLIAVGMCFGAAIAMLFEIIRARRSS